MHIVCILTLDSTGVEAVQWRICLGEKVLIVLQISVDAIEVSNYYYICLYLCLFLLFTSLTISKVNYLARVTNYFASIKMPIKNNAIVQQHR